MEAERKVAEAERKTAETERKAARAQRNAVEAENSAAEAKKRIAEVEEALEAEKVWADERVKTMEKNIQQEMENRLREAQKLAVERQRFGVSGSYVLRSTPELRGDLKLGETGHGMHMLIDHADGACQGGQDGVGSSSMSRGGIDKPASETKKPVAGSLVSVSGNESNTPVRMQTDFDHSSESESERSLAQASYNVPRVDKSKFHQVNQGSQPHHLGQNSRTQSQVRNINLWSCFLLRDHHSRYPSRWPLQGPEQAERDSM